MTPFLKSVALAAVLAVSSTIAHADTIQLGSFATGASSLGNANTAMNYAGYNATLAAPSAGTASSFFLDPSTVWGTPATNSTWVGYSATAGPVGTSNPAFGYYTFTTTFTAAAAGTYSGSMSILADDTAEVLLNGAVLMPFGTLGSDAHCADSGPSCLVAETFSIGNVSLLGGANANTLTFVVQQAGTGSTGGSGDPSGVDFDGSLSTLSSSSIPEPASLLLVGTGLLGLTGVMTRRLRS